MRVIGESTVADNRLILKDDLCALGLKDELSIRMWLLTLQGKGLVKMTESGYVLTGRGKARIQNNT
ncbi:MAG TPA: hypothetical protein VNI77_04140 [Nitrososphaera sp.]|nr:hypothetical protein [Nitrososphaera sp.]